MHLLSSLLGIMEHIKWSLKMYCLKSWILLIIIIDELVGRWMRTFSFLSKLGKESFFFGYKNADAFRSSIVCIYSKQKHFIITHCLKYSTYLYFYRCKIKETLRISYVYHKMYLILWLFTVIYMLKDLEREKKHLLYKRCNRSSIKVPRNFLSQNCRTKTF